MHRESKRTEDRREELTDRLDPGGDTLDGTSPLVLCVVGAGATRTVPLAHGQELVIGRGSDADVLVEALGVSRRHVRLRTGPPMSVEDLGSANGTKVDDVRIPPGQLLPVTPGQMIRLGTVLLLVTPAAGQPRSTAPSSQSASVRAGGEQPAPSLVFNSAAMLEVLDMVESVAASPLSVLLLGETGVGKEVLAEEIHRRSPRANNPLVRLNCAALSESLLESELFGHEKGAFTGATGTKRGLLETAHEGTVFLDEVGELSPSIQVKLLRVLEERRVTRVGALRSRAIDVRFIAATNRNLEHEIDNERFRRDLFFRLNGVKIIIPPLRARLEEIEGLAQLFIERISRQLGRAAAPALSARALRILREHGWPGNVRELRNTVERAAVLCKGDVIEPEHLLLDPPPSASAAPASSLMGAPRAGPVAPAGEPRHALSFADPTTASLPDEVEALERRRIVEALERCCGNQTHAARMLGISRNKLLARIAYFGLPRPRSPRG